MKIITVFAIFALVVVPFVACDVVSPHQVKQTPVFWPKTGGSLI
jgi:hypothetical protein